VGDDTGGASSTHDKTEQDFLLIKQKQRRPLGKPRCRQRYNIKKNLTRVGCEGMTRLHLVWAFMHTLMTLRFHARRTFLNQLNDRQFLETVFCTTGHKQYSMCSKGYGHSMMKRVYRRMGLSSLNRNSEVGPLAPAGGCWECGAMLWPGAGEQSRTDRCCAAASCAAANLRKQITKPLEKRKPL